MHVAVVVGTLMLGSWVLNSPEAEEEAGIPEDVQQQETGVVPPSHTLPYNTSPPRPGHPMERGAPGAPGAQPGSATEPRPMPSSGGSAPSPTQSMQMFMPSAPTDASTGLFGQPVAPTSNAAPNSIARMSPIAPTSGFRSKLPGPLNQNRNVGSQGNSGTATSPASEKAFGGYRPTTGVSPYMNLFRLGGDTIDNYTSLVRPQIEQRFLNQQFNREIRGLEGNTRMQRVDLQQLYRANQTLQGVATPQFYMNYGNYYQGARQ